MHGNLFGGCLWRTFQISPIRGPCSVATGLPNNCHTRGQHWINCAISPGFGQFRRLCAAHGSNLWRLKIRAGGAELFCCTPIDMWHELGWMCQSRQEMRTDSLLIVPLPPIGWARAPARPAGSSVPSSRYRWLGRPAPSSISLSHSISRLWATVQIPPKLPNIGRVRTELGRIMSNLAGLCRTRPNLAGLCRPKFGMISVQFRRD